MTAVTAGPAAPETSALRAGPAAPVVKAARRVRTTAAPQASRVWAAPAATVVTVGLAGPVSITAVWSSGWTPSGWPVGRVAPVVTVGRPGSAGPD